MNTSAASTKSRKQTGIRRMIIKLSRKLSITLTWRPRARVSRLLAMLLAAASTPALALPTAGTVVSGNVGETRTDTSMTVTQTTDKAIVNRDGYSIGYGESVTYVQPSTSSVILERVTGGDASEIFGMLSANGQIFLVNSNGVFFAPGAQVDVSGIVVSTLGISDGDFAAGKYTFQNGGNASSVVNQGSLNGKYVALVAPTVDNSGSISGNGGTVALAAGDRVSLDLSGDGLLNVSVDAAAAGASISHSGAIIADGGKVFITAKSADALMDTVLNVSGLVRAQSLNEQNGVIRLDGGSAGVVSVSGTLDAQGGEVAVSGEWVGNTGTISANDAGKVTIDSLQKTVMMSTSVIEAKGGGEVRINQPGAEGFTGARANTSTVMYQGAVIDTTGGTDNGFVEVSGAAIDVDAGTIKAGAILFDPLNITFSNAADANVAGFSPPGDLTEAFADDLGLDSNFRVDGTGILNTVAAGSTITFQATNDITVSNAFNLNTATTKANVSLVLDAGHDINVDADVTADGTGSIVMTAVNTIDSTGFGITTGGGAVTLNAATMSLGAITTGAGLLTINNSGAATQSGVFAGSGGLTKTGAGTLTLSQTNTYTGTTTISAGTLALGAAGVVADAGSISVNGGTLDIGANNETVTGVTLVSGSITGTTGILTADTYAVESGNISAKLGDKSGGGTSTLTKTTAGTVTLSGDNAYEGQTTVSAGTLTVSHANGLGTTGSGTTVASGATLNINGVAVGAEALNVQGSGVSAGAITGTGSLAGAITLAGDTTVGVASGTLTLSGIINDGGSTYGLTKVGAGELVLTGNNGYDGLTQVSAGTLTAAHDSALGGKIGVGSGTSVASGAKLVLQDADVGLEAIDVAGGTLAMTGTATATGVTFSAGSSTLDYAGYTSAVAVNQQGGTATGITTITNFGNIGTLVGNGTDTTLTGANGGVTFNITGVNSGTAGSLAFSGVGNLTGGSGDDSFIFADAGSLTGDVAGGAGTTDTLNLSAKTGAVAINQETGAATGIGGTFGGIEAVVGNGTDTTLTGANGGVTFNITGVNSGTAGSLAFSGISSLTGGTGNDSFVFADAGSLSGNVAGGTGTTDTLNLSAKTGAVAINQETGAATGLGGSFSGIEAVVGNGVNTTLTGTAAAQTFTITGADDGTAGTLAFTDVGNLTGGAGDDSFVLSGGSLSGAIDGGGGNNSLTGGNVANTWTVTAANTGTVTGVTGVFSNIQNLIGGTDNDSFTINAAGSLSGSVAGGAGTTDTLDLHLKSGAVAINQETGAATGLGGSFSGIEAVVGNGVNTTLTGADAGQTFTITGADDGTAGTLAFTDVGNLTGGAGDDSFVLNGGSLSGAVNGGGGNNSLTGGNVANTWTVTAANTGTVTGVTGVFSNIQNLIGGTDNDSFTINAAGSLSGSVAGGAGTTDTLDLHLKSGAVAINQETGAATDVTGGFSGIEAVVGNGVNTTLTGADAGQTFTITGADAGTAGSLAFTGVGNLTGGAGADTFTGTSGSLSGNIVDASGVTTLGGTLQTTGSQSYTGAVILATDTTITAGTDVTFGSTVDGNTTDGAYARSLSVTSSAGDVSFGGPVGGVTALNSLTIDTSGAMALPVINAAALSVTAAGAITDSTTMTVTGLASFDGTSILLDGVNNFGKLNFNSAGDVDITEASEMNLDGDNTAQNLALTSTSGSIDAFYPSYGTPTAAKITTTGTATFTATSAGAHVYSGSSYDDQYGGQVKVIADGYIWLYTSGDIELGEISSLSGSSVVVQAAGDITNDLGGASINAPYDGVSKFGYVYLYSANGGIGASAVSGVVKDPSKGIYFTPETKQIIMSLGNPVAQAAATFDLDTQVVEMGDTQPFSAANGQIYFQTTAAPDPGDTPAPTGATQGNQLFLCSLQSVSCTDAFTGDVFYSFDIGGILNAASQDLFNSTFGTDNIRVAIQNGFLTEFGVVPPGIDAIDGDGISAPVSNLVLVSEPPPPFLIDEEELKRKKLK